MRGGNPQGGSTLTMQLARSLWRLNTRTPAGKLEQVARAVQLELFYSKRRSSKRIERCAVRNDVKRGHRSVVYFDRMPDALTLPEALALAVIPPGPGATGARRAG